VHWKNVAQQRGRCGAVTRTVRNHWVPRRRVWGCDKNSKEPLGPTKAGNFFSSLGSLGSKERSYKLS
jgi:hypothetical protein